MYLTSDEGVFSYLNYSLAGTGDAPILTLEIREPVTGYTEYDVKENMYRQLYEANEKQSAPSYPGYDPIVKDYITKYLESGKWFIVAIRFSPDFDPMTAGATYRVTIQPWLETLASHFPISIVGLTTTPQLFTNQYVGAIAIELGKPINLRTAF